MITPDNITSTDVQTAVGEYPGTIPEALHSLDEYRLLEIPRTLTERRAKSGAYLDKDEVLKLVEWKLKHGTFRPTLLALVRSNPEDVIKETTKEAFSLLADGSNPEGTTVLAALDILCRLRGIGPATAALLMSEFAPNNIPFFSDEFFRWSTSCSDRDVEGRWKKATIKYTKASYSTLFNKTQEIMGKLASPLGQKKSAESPSVVTMLDLEKAAYVFARTSVSRASTEKVPRTTTTTAGEGRKRAAPQDSAAEPDDTGTQRSLRSKRKKSSNK